MKVFLTLGQALEIVTNGCNSVLPPLPMPEHIETSGAAEMGVSVAA